MLVSWYIANHIFFAIPIPTTFVGPLDLPVIEIFSWERSVVIFAVILLLHHMGHYKDRIHYFFQLRSIFLACACGLIGESVLRLYLNSPTSTNGLIIAWGLMAIFIMGFRAVTANFICSKTRFLQQIVIMNNGPLGRHTKDAIARKSRLGYRLATIEEHGGNPNFDTLFQIAISNSDSGVNAELVAASAATTPDTLMLYAFDNFDQTIISRAVKTLEALGRPFGFITSQTGVRLPYFKEFPFFGEDLILLLPNQKDTPTLSKVVKRLFDVTFAALLLIILSPLLVTFAFLISRDGGPIVFSHKRVGRNGKSFGCLKFRSMIQNADRKLEEHLKENPAAREEWEKSHKLRNDPRVTGIGKFLRKSSFDEAAQLINIIRGDMSFVGPRPIVAGEIKKYGPVYREYCEVRPGITGLWQVSGRNNTSYVERVELDKWYITNRSLWLDLFILIKTVPVVILRRGAF